IDPAPRRPELSRSMASVTRLMVAGAVAESRFAESVDIDVVPDAGPDAVPNAGPGAVPNADPDAAPNGERGAAPGVGRLARLPGPPLRPAVGCGLRRKRCGRARPAARCMC